MPKQTLLVGFIILLGIACATISVLTLTVGTRSTDAIAPVDPLLSKLIKLPESNLRNGTMVVLKTKHEALLAINNLARSMAKLIGAIGFLLFCLAWWVHSQKGRLDSGR